jgi:signal transduction histidine kinase
VYVDRDLWEKIVLNLLSNAFKYTKEGSITGKLTEDATGVELSISENIFERFYTVEQSKGIPELHLVPHFFRS